MEPIAVADKVRDVMLFTVPGLKDEEDDPIVAPDVPMRDDGAEGRFAKAYIHDEIPWMDVSNEVRDLMILAVPSIDITADDLAFADTAIPDDGMEASWFAVPEHVPESATVEIDETEIEVQTEAVASPETVTAAIAAPATTLSIDAPAAVHMIAMPEPVCALPEAAPVAVEEEEVPGIEVPMETEEAPEACVESIVAEAVPENPIAAVEEAAPTVPEPEEAPAVEDITVTNSLPETTFEVAEDAATEITEDTPSVVFSFGTQEFHGRGWKVCFSF